MNYQLFNFFKLQFVVLLQIALLCFYCTSATAATKDRYDIIYLLSQDLERVLDYKDELEGIFDTDIVKKLKVMGRGDEYALLYDGNDSAATVSKTLIEHGAILNNAGFDEPYATKDQDYHLLYNVSYGIGPNLEPLKKRYDLIYNLFGDDIHSKLFIEKTDYGNYVLVYRYRGSRLKTTTIAKNHANILRKKGISASLVKENNNIIVYGESSLINDETVEKVVTVKSETQPKPSVMSSSETEIIHIKAVAKAKKNLSSNGRSLKGASLRSSKIAEYGRLEKSVEEYIDKLRSKKRISLDESTGWVVYDLAKDQVVIDINANREFQAASMIKPFVALAFFHEVKEGKYKYGPKSRRKMEAMIQRSSNSATNWVMRQVGGPRSCNALLAKHYPHIFKNTDIKEYIPAGGKTYLNSATPLDYVRFLKALWKKQLPYSSEIRRLMALPGRDRIYNGTPIPKGTLVYNKTGSTAHLCGDMGILVPRTKRGGRYPYAIVGVIEKRSRPSHYGRWMDSRGKVIREVSTLVYERMKQQHQLR